jgi:hypothetical protein
MSKLVKYKVTDTVLYGEIHPEDSKWVTISERPSVYLAEPVDTLLTSALALARMCTDIHLKGHPLFKAAQQFFEEYEVKK